jgi:hypothetical protein
VKHRHGHQILEVLGASGAWIPFEGEGDPAGQARRRVRTHVPENAPVIAVIGLGLGHVLEAIDEVSAASHVVALELTPALAALSASVPRVKERLAAGRLTIAVAPAYEALAVPAVRTALANAGTTLPVVISPGLAADRADTIGAAGNVLRQRLFEAKANEDARRANAGRYLLNTLRNLTAIAEEADVASLADCFAGAPAIVLAAGPTLDNAIEDLRASAAHAVIIAVDTSLKPLLKTGIAPDLVVAMDPTEQNARHLYDIPDLPDTWLVAEPSVNPAILRAFPGRSFLLSLGFDPWPWIAQAGITRGKLRAWGSVATTAYDLALVMGCNPIGLAGADFSFPGGQPYCRNTEYEHDWADAAAWGESLESIWYAWTHKWRDVTEADVDGCPVLTAPHLVAFRDWVRKDIERVAGERHIFNAAGGILAGPAVPRGPFRQVIPCGFDARHAVPARLRGAHVPSENGSVLSRMRRELIDGLHAAGVELFAESPAHAWMRFAPATSIDEIRQALTASPECISRTLAGPHLAPEQSARLRKMIAGEECAPPSWAVTNPDGATAICRDVLNALTSVAGYSPRLTEGTSGRLVPASALVEWTGSAYASVRQLEAVLASSPADTGAAPFLRGSVEPLASPATVRADAQEAARTAVVRQTGLALSLRSGSSSDVAGVLRAIDPSAGGELSCQISIGDDIRATASLRRSDLGRLLTGRIACGAGETTIEISAHEVTLRLSEQPNRPGVTRFLGRHPQVVRSRMLGSAEFGAAQFALTLDAHSAVLNPLIGPSSVRVREDGAFDAMPAWPHAIIGEVPVPGGSWIAWSNVATEPLLMHRTPDGVVDVVERAPFRPNRVIDWDDRFLCSAHDGGLWLWNPGGEPRKVADAPPTLSLLKTPAGVRLDPVVRSPQGYTTRTRLDYAWLWQGGSELARVALGSGGPCWSVAASGEWTARAFPHDDLVQLTHESGRVVDLACYYPVTLAWAGASLIALSSTGGTILLFENLRDALNEQPAWNPEPLEPGTFRTFRTLEP